jgi:hypothetical protein
MTRQDNEFRELLSSAHVPDDGFTDRVMAQVPVHAERPLLRPLILGSAVGMAALMASMVPTVGTAVVDVMNAVAFPASWNASVPSVLLGLLLLGSVFVVAGDDA